MERATDAASGSAAERARVAELAEACRRLKTEHFQLQKQQGTLLSSVQAQHAQVRACRVRCHEHFLMLDWKRDSR